MPIEMVMHLPMGGLSNRPLMADFSPYRIDPGMNVGGTLVSTLVRDYPHSGRFGLNQYALSGVQPRIDLDGEFTVECYAWIDPADKSGASGVVQAPMVSFMQYGNNAQRFQALYVAPGSGNISSWSDANWQTLSIPGADYQAGEWVHLCVQRRTYPTVMNAIYLNGVKKDESVGPAPLYRQWVIANYSRSASAHRHSSNLHMQDVKVWCGGVLYDMEGFQPPDRLGGHIHGVITDENGSPAKRDVVILTRPPRSQSIVQTFSSDPETGEYGGFVPYGEEVSRIVFAEAEGPPLLNDLIDRIIPG